MSNRATLPASRAFGGSGWQRPLGAIAFAPDGTPGPITTVFVADLVHLVSGTRVLGAAEWQWPRALYDLVVGRVLGRVLAHELGHFLLRMRQHTTGGLMRPLQRADDLVSPSRSSVTLSPAETARVR